MSHYKIATRNESSKYKYITSYYRISSSEASTYLWTFTCVHAYKCIMWGVTKLLPEAGLINNRKVSCQRWPASWSLESTRCSHQESSLSGRSCAGKALQKSSFWVGSKLLFRHFWCRYTSMHRTWVARIVIAESCFPGKSVHCHLHASRFLCPAQIKVSLSS